jgi:hypothetical protein
MQIYHAYIGGAVAWAVALLAATASAQPSFNLHLSDPQAELDEADRAFREGRYQDAVVGYLAADRLRPAAATQLALAKTYEQLDDVSRALAAYREYFARAPGAPDRAAVRARVDALAVRLGQQGVQQINVSSEPAGASLVIDGKPSGTTPLYLDLPPGEHVVRFELKGFKPEQVGFELRLSEPLNVMTTLAVEPPGAQAAAVAAAAVSQPQPLAAPPEAPPAAVTPVAASEQAHDSTWMRVVGLAALGGSVVALGAAVGFEVARANSEQRAEQQKEQVAFKSDLDKASSQQTAARVFAVSAGVLAAIGGIFLVLSIPSAEATPSPAGVAIACGATECGAVYRRTF